MQAAKKIVLNVGGNSRHIALPEHFADFDQLLLDIDASRSPDLVCDARNLFSLEPGQFDAVYCSHTLEHFYRHDVQSVLKGILHVLKPGGFAHIRVPDLHQIFKAVLEDEIDLEGALYEAPVGTVSPLDTIYGYSKIIQASGNDYFAHKTGFSPLTLQRALVDAGFQRVYISEGFYEVGSYAIKGEPMPWVPALLDLQMQFGIDTLIS